MNDEDQVISKMKVVEEYLLQLEKDAVYLLYKGNQKDRVRDLRDVARQARDKLGELRDQFEQRRKGALL